MATQHNTTTTTDTLESLYWEARDNGRETLADAIGLALDASTESSDDHAPAHGIPRPQPTTLNIVRHFNGQQLENIQLHYCCETCPLPETATVDPTFFEQAGSPVCGECGDDMAITGADVNNIDDVTECEARERVAAFLAHRDQWQTNGHNQITTYGPPLLASDLRELLK